MAEDVKSQVVAAVKAPVTPVFWVKAILYGLAFLAIVFIVLSVKDKLFPKPLPPTQTYGSVGKVVYEANKRKLILFAEPYVGVDTKDKGSIGIRAGCRWEF